MKKGAPTFLLICQVVLSDYYAVLMALCLFVLLYYLRMNSCLCNQSMEFCELVSHCFLVLVIIVSEVKLNYWH